MSQPINGKACGSGSGVDGRKGTCKQPDRATAAIIKKGRMFGQQLFQSPHSCAINRP